MKVDYTKDGKMEIHFTAEELEMIKTSPNPRETFTEFTRFLKDQAELSNKQHEIHRKIKKESSKKFWTIAACLAYILGDIIKGEIKKT